MRRLALAAAGVLVLPCFSFALKTEKLKGVAANGRDMEVVAEAAMVRFSSGTPLEDKRAALSGRGFTLVKDYVHIGWSFVTMPSNMPVLAGLALLRAVPGVSVVEPDIAYRPVLQPNDPSVSQQYALSQINAFSAWEYGTGADNPTTVAVIDAGVDSTHLEFAGRMGGLAHEFCDPAGGACVAEPVPALACNHGTHVAGVAAALGNNSQGIAGLNWGAKILSERVFRTTDCTVSCGDTGFNNGCVTDAPGIIDAINHVVGLQNTAPYGKIVINISIGGAAACSVPVQLAMNAAVAAGIPVVVASGNDGGAVNTPANCATAVGGTGIIPVGATDSNNTVTAFSSRGPELAANGLVAPGFQVLTTEAGGGYVNATGTSFSAPHVAGVAALMLAKKPGLAVAQIQADLRGGADNIGVSNLGISAGMQPQGNVAGAGRLDAFRSMRLAVNGTLADFQGDQKAIAFPNPFRVTQNGTISITVPISLQGANTAIKIYTVGGELVRELSGQTWDGKNDAGALVASGTYIFIVSTANGSTRGRLALIR